MYLISMHATFYHNSSVFLVKRSTDENKKIMTHSTKNPFFKILSFLFLICPRSTTPMFVVMVPESNMLY